ncbi:MAG: hypothetical protein AABN95_22385 [Acidobacteriota bacterium]
MKNIAPKTSRVPFPFVLEELTSLRLTVKKVFGFTYVYLDERLLFSLREDIKRSGTNGMWLFTSKEHVDSLVKEFPELSRRQVWRSGKNCWVVLASRLEYFEEYAFKACGLILNGDRRIGRLTRRATGVQSTTFRLPLRDTPTRFSRASRLASSSRAS